MDNEARLYAELEARGIAFEVAEHHAVFTVDESRELNATLPGAHTKNLFLKDNGGQFWLVTVPGEIRVDLKALPATIGSKRLSFGKAEDLLRLLGLTPGSVTPLGAINDAAGDVQVVLDRDLSEAGTVWVHPLRNTASLGLSGSDLVRALDSWQHNPQIADIPRLGEAVSE
ncbi:MAG TPA: prolyl-tRNA synthetase associated domain-containing protein [Sphingorhabdus sp.]|uniref:prolyl-tRNA synthetase associated domain-containing protein n=1 Tax=Sphingorhabdus sp. TaxID=1902408 RepID=UPI002CF7B9BF|nr:prolyl-tRNA synthetase associated domain-containing protein [Sphingorhabdus sp.]HMT42250.1 prolyl-tRNA synthetase associated domain-containing protein [Sphingorhabdus sp.]HMU22962.1 prolyl-tRNA synthetase associated domain-containing protein [Sphingorhabdus sp.]